MQKYLKYIFFVLSSLLIIVFIITYYPKSIGRMPVFMLFLVSDVLLWFFINNKFITKTPKISNMVAFFYWLPMNLLLITSIVSFIVNYTQWNNVFRMFMLGSIALIYFAKFIIIIIYSILQLLKLLFNKTFFKNYERGRYSKSLFLSMLAGISLLIILSSGMLMEQKSFKVKYVNIMLEELPQSFDGFKIIQISDMHLGSWVSVKKMERLIHLINSHNPDVVFFTGDIVNYRTSEALPFKQCLSQLKSLYGVYAVLGNHDYGDYAYWKNPNEKIENNTELKLFYRNIGWNLLNNESKILVKGKDTIVIIGVENWGSMKRFKKTGDLNKALYPYNNIAVKLLLSHDPSHWEKVVSKDFKDIDITFSGHTHGMQFGIDTKRFKFSPAQIFYKYWSGLYRLRHKSQKTQYLYVNNGLGNIVYPGRVGILPEVTVFTLKSIKSINNFSGETNREKVRLK